MYFNKINMELLLNKEMFILARRKTHEEFLKEVEIKGNGEYVVLSEYVNSKTPVKLLHTVCNQTYTPLPNNFVVKNQRCSYCAGNKVKTFSEIQKELNKLNPDYKIIKPVDTYKNIHSKVIVQHSKCKKEYPVEANRFKHGDRCPFCCNIYTHMTDGEKVISDYLKEKKIPHKFQYIYYYDKTNKRKKLIFDFLVKFNNKIYIIEYDGIFHFEPRYGIDKFKKQQRLDKMKDDFCVKNNIEMIRIPYTEFNNINTILENTF